MENKSGYPCINCNETIDVFNETYNLHSNGYSHVGCQAKPGDYSIGSSKWPGFAKVAEEAGELMQVLAKIQARNGDTTYFHGEDMKQRLMEEIADLQAALKYMVSANKLNALEIEDRANMKYKRFWLWHEAQKGG